MKVKTIYGSMDLIEFINEGHKIKFITENKSHYTILYKETILTRIKNLFK